MARNPYYESIQAVKEKYQNHLSQFTLEEQVKSPLANQLDTPLGLIAKSSALKIIHPIFIQRYSNPRMKYRNEPIKTIGLDVETRHTTGEPMLLGIWYPDIEHYRPLYHPKLEHLHELISGLISNGTSRRHIVVWGNLDIQILIRLFHPTDEERTHISRGLSARVKDNRFIADPPLIRPVGKEYIYISHYIPGRSLKLGIIDRKGFHAEIWVFNLSQFFKGTISNTAKALKLQWIEFDKSTHLVDWARYARSAAYRSAVNNSNKQDAKTVQTFADILQEQFNATFETYPSLLVSTGSLTDAAVGRLLEDEDYKSLSWYWLVNHVWNEDKETVYKAEILLAEAFSAGYVDQFAIGYFPEVCTADIASAYPHKIRNLPDLRYSYWEYGDDPQRLEEIIQYYDVETIVFRGLVTIPDTLHFHPITIKTYNRENYRPIGTFYASYLLEERAFAIQHGATFQNEEWAALIITKRAPSPIALVSIKLGQLRDEQLATMRASTNNDEIIFLDGQQYLTKVVDNSIYGKTVMTTEVVENIDGSPQITGYVTGDRFNQLLGAIITARTRVQIADACMKIEARGGKPIMTMTDSIYWEGSEDNLPEDLINNTKTPGYFESPKIVKQFYILKTGQYEYFDPHEGKWEYKLRGLPISWDHVTGKSSFYRTQIKQQTARMLPWKDSSQVKIRLHTRRLISIGYTDLERLGKVEEGITEIRPFVMSTKHNDKYVPNWNEVINGHRWLPLPYVREEDSEVANYPLFYLKELYENNIVQTARTRVYNRRKVTRGRVKNVRELKKLYIWKALHKTHKAAPPNPLEMTWRQLEKHYDITRKELLGY